MQMNRMRVQQAGGKGAPESVITLAGEESVRMDRQQMTLPDKLNMSLG